jgi:hypothetical protein
MRLLSDHLSRALLALGLLAGPPAGLAATASPDSMLGAAASSASSADSSADADLAPTSSPPWTPSHSVPHSLPWEAVLRFPGQVVSLPLSGLGRVTEKFLLFAEGRNLVQRTTHTFARAPQFGVHLAPASLGDRTGLGARARLTPPYTGSFVRIDASASTRGYSRSRVALARGPALLEYGQDWRPSDRFYGIGLQSREEDVSSVAHQMEHVEARISWPMRVADTLRSYPRLSLWAGPRATVIRRGGHDSAAPSFDAVFPSLSDQRDLRVEHMTWGGEAGWNSRGGVPHWSHGLRVLGRAERFDRPFQALALRDAHARGAQFNRFEALAEGGFSFHRDPRTVRLTVLATHQQITADAANFLLTDLSTLGGSAGLAGYEPARFQDLDRLVGRLSYIFPLAGNYEFDVHGELGGVYPDVRHDAKLTTLKPSYGVGFRPRNRQRPLGNIGVDWSPERLRFRYSLGGVE